MKKIIIGLSITCFFINAAEAQIRRDPHFAADSLMRDDTTRRTTNKNILDELNLTKEQRTSIKQIRQSRKEGRETIENNDSLSADQKKYQLKEFKKETERQIEAVLTNEQLEKYKALKKQMHDERKNQGKTSMTDDPGFESAQ